MLLIIQAAFFEKGMSGLIPIRLKDVASALDLHESTVSRAIGKNILKHRMASIHFALFLLKKLLAIPEKRILFYM